MQIRHLKISNFRGISELDWKPAGTFNCLIGAGDSGKSTILDAVEAVLSSKWFSFNEADFMFCDTAIPVVIEATIGELSRALKSDARLGLHMRGWTVEGILRDEPEDDDEPVLTVRLTVDATMEPIWELVCDRVEDSRTLSNRDRAMFGLVRLAGDDARHLAWGQGSVLARLTSDTGEASTRLAEALRTAKAMADLGQIKALTDAAEAAEGFAKGLGAYVDGTYTPGLELGRAGLSSGSIALHDNNVPLRLSGLGTRRLATLAIQKSAVSEGAIVLVDEIEHGLEPHRIIGAIAQLKSVQTAAISDRLPVGHVIMTTHSDVALGEAGAEALHVIQLHRRTRTASISRPAAPVPINALLRFTPRALFARKILVTEGNTELGLILGLRETWPANHGNRPIEQMGVAIADGNGHQAFAMAMALANLGFSTAIFRDSDVPMPPDRITALHAAGIQTLEYRVPMNTERAIFSAANDRQVQELLNFVRMEHGDDTINGNLINVLQGSTVGEVALPFDTWEILFGGTGAEHRIAIAGLADRKKWFKDQRVGRGLAPIASRIIAASPQSELSQTIADVEAWIYD